MLEVMIAGGHQTGGLDEVQMLYQGACRGDWKATEKANRSKTWELHFMAMSPLLQPSTLCSGNNIQGDAASCLFSVAKPAGRGSGVQLMLAVDGHQAVLLVYKLSCE